MRSKHIAVVFAMILTQGAASSVEPDFVFVNKQGQSIEIRYWDTQKQEGCGTLASNQECEIKAVGDDSHYCWQFAGKGGRTCDPVEDGCEISPGRIEIDDSPSAEACLYDPDAEE
jgi:hypothetical protein